ncbi:2-Methylisocitrate lyase, PEP mutase family [Chishuiella changwenlii]|uniref:2-Methylisocitrate lyase, PEP mutase family n=1 Tax=Chishuiella changwenlii TaxID=1434701 RepID=A0A1M7C4P4_9FLAO|nr:isocitrate lyase/phosphoenolpyruvate mutase family protein [Chishuiella changwenlii]GGF05660.1 carboxyvinyl-carboxyphosphonate phosphorylmutase [Chishuiella changwenlii]SHL62116.1 2-Methylisocitrate lyase, PEP mutase family [Chishuiella changwenlii]
MTTTYQKFLELHQQDKPLIIGNVWNVQSAKMFEKLNFQAIGTSSAAIAHSFGHEDGEQMPLSDLLFVVERIIKNINLPLSVDIEFGYGNTAEQIAENIIALEKLGAVGINIEDSYLENGERKLKDIALFSSLLNRVKNILKDKGISIFINVRCDTFLLNGPDAFESSIDRIKKYEEVGANGIFLPCIKKESDIETIISATKLPLNVMCTTELPNFEVLEKIGVKRISMGNFLNDYVYNSAENKTIEILKNQSFNSLF